MRFSSIQKHLLVALATFGVALTSIVWAENEDANPIVDEGVLKYSTEIQSSKDKLADLRNRKQELAEKLSSSQRREVAKDSSSDSRDPLEGVNRDITAVEERIERAVKKKDYLIANKQQLTTSDLIEKRYSENEKTMEEVESRLHVLNTKLNKTAESCKECKLAMLTDQRLPASDSKTLETFKQQLRERNDLEEHQDSLRIEHETLMDLHTIHMGQESVDHPNRVFHGADPEQAK
jgi:hypothetical protein